MLNGLRKVFGTPILTAGALIVLQAAVTYSGITGSIPHEIPDLNTVPEQVSGWTTVDSVALEPEVVDYLRPDTYIQRRYIGPDRSQPVNLFVAYFKSLKSGYGPHSPAVCLPGSGWLTKSNSVLTIPVPSGSIPVNEYWLIKGNQQILVHYWYQNRRNTWSREVMSKLYLLPDMIRYRRSDVALVRITAPVESSGIESARSSLMQFTAVMFPILHSRMPE